MSIFLSKLEIPGFSGGVSLWTQYVNTIETGGGGGTGSMSEACFTIDDSSVEYLQVEEGYTLLVSGGFSPDGIAGYDFWKSDENYAYALNTLTLKVTPAFDGLFPQTITFSVNGSFGEEGTYYLPYNVYVEYFDQDTSYPLYSASTEPDTNFYFEDITVPLVYYEGSQGFKGLFISYSSSLPY